MRPLKLIQLVLLLTLLPVFFLSVTRAHALERGEDVYVKTQKGVWSRGVYVARRGDCFLIQRLSAGTEVIEGQPELFEGAIEKGSILKRRGLPEERNSYRVLETSQECHIVELHGHRYFKLDEVRSARDFRSLLGSKEALVVGHEIYARTGYDPEEWMLARVLDERHDCYETDTGVVLSSDDVEALSFPSRTPTRVKVGDRVRVRPSFRQNAWVDMTVKAKSGKQLTVELGDPNGEIYHKQKVSVGKITSPSKPLALRDFAALKPKEHVLRLVSPPACDVPYYEPLLIISKKPTCYIIERIGSRDAVLPTQVIPAQSLSVPNS